MQRYQPGSHVMVRTPLLPLEDLPRGSLEETRKHIRRLLSRPEVQEAILIASPSLYAALPAYLLGEARTLDARQRRQIELGALKYLLRASARPTPYGTFCGVAVAALDEHFSIGVAPTALHRTVSQLDFSQVLAVAVECEALLTEEHNPRLYTHPATLRFGQRFFLENITRRGQGDNRCASIRATPAAEGILGLCAKGENLQTVLAWLDRQYPHRTRQQNFKALRHLMDAGFLFTDLRPSPMCADPVQHLLARIEGIPAFAVQAAQLREVQQLLTAADALPPGEGLDLYQQLGVAGTFSSARGEGTENNQDVQAPRRVDLVTALTQNRFSRAVAEEAAHSHALLLHLASRESQAPLERYLERFRERYGERLVPLLELLSAAVGLGPVEGYSRPAPLEPGPPPSMAFNAKDRYLFDLALRHQGKEEVQLREHEEALLALQSSVPVQTLPESGEIYVRVLAPSQEAIEAGQYQLVLGPMGAVSMAGKTFGRFARALPAEAYQQFKRQENTPGVRHANSSYFPISARLMNVNAQCASEAWEVPYGAPPLHEDRVILPSEILVGADGSGFFFISATDGSRVVVHANHMLSLQFAPNVVRFLEEASRQRQRAPLPFSWGRGAGLLPYLPRVVYGKTILSPRTWQVPRAVWLALRGQDESMVCAGVEDIRQTHGLPMRVEVGREDNLLVLDLDNPLHVAVLLEEVRKGEGEHLELRESFTQPEHLWKNAEAGAHLLEFVVPLFHPSPEPVSLPNVVQMETGWKDRVFPVGGEWIYLRLYPGFASRSELLRLHMAPLLEALAPQTRCAFHVLYNDPGEHIRLRVLPADGQHEMVLGRLMVWCADLRRNGLLREVVVTDYERELERYGGAGLMEMSEVAFHSSSRLVLRYLCDHPAEDPSARMAFTAWVSLLGLRQTFEPVLLRSFLSGLAAHNRTFLEGQLEPKRRYNEVKQLRGMLMVGRGHTPPQTLSPELAQAVSDHLHQQGKVFEQAALQLRPERFMAFVASHLHMHANRMGLSRIEEALVYQGMHDAVVALIHTAGRTPGQPEAGMVGSNGS
ncbi:lantibiotic dehydratase [Deinococcus cellulosilyticus]|uniref:Uncharacterized protein n=1 Tax=Deinococcus cellulosilyticus (strain DSM 18568 / NBRC 106333 / KACC 11606 / 5516J-15) TaxID=1223518 RepID=A0A511N944_DEIC1|nr:lantibiotic dehydratase [Deinococcus cellulosilyticus]GEM49379.1 hypothetical protein DC3_50140 [Deinococcus cellulosilyticus NBRC 106333 = KACC 11606]